MSKTQRFEAKGPRGEACIIERTMTGENLTHRLGTGDRLAPTDDPAVFETFDGKRRFTLRPQAMSTFMPAQTSVASPAGMAWRTEGVSLRS